MASSRHGLKQEKEGAKPPGTSVLNESDGQPQWNKKKGTKEVAGGEEGQSVAGDKQFNFFELPKAIPNFPVLPPSLLIFLTQQPALCPKLLSIAAGFCLIFEKLERAHDSKKMGSEQLLVHLGHCVFSLR